MSDGGYGKYEKHYSEESFRHKLTVLPRQVGRDFVLQALLLYALLTDGETPVWAKALVAGALGYLVLPLDAVPDFLPVVGYLDDAAAMGLVLAQLQKYITPEVRRRAESLLPELFRA